MGKLLSEIKQSKPFASLEEEVFINIARTAEVLMWKESEFLKSYDITSAQYNVLRILRGAGAEGLICREIGERMVTRDPDVTKLLDRLEARGLLTRERQQADRRVITVRISQQGLKLLKEIDRPLQEMIKGLLSHLGAQRLQTLNELLEEARERAG
ncbi:MAG TPA: MarR family transcriptional regulator [Blastocatellia bacterium]|nr:MarR family transcriptional regulator [Blastocatellia bacterium]